MALSGWNGEPMSLSIQIDIGGERVYESASRAFSAEGLTMDAIAAPLQAVRFAWLEFSLPDGERVRALGELVARGAGELRFGFKHVFPNQRAALARFVERQGALSRAA